MAETQQYDTSYVVSEDVCGGVRKTEMPAALCAGVVGYRRVPTRANEQTRTGDAPPLQCDVMFADHAQLQHGATVLGDRIHVRAALVARSCGVRRVLGAPRALALSRATLSARTNQTLPRDGLPWWEPSAWHRRCA